MNPPRERSRRGSSREATRPGRQSSREALDPNQPGRWRRRDRVRSRSRAVSRARDADRQTRGEPPRVDLQTILVNEGEEAARQHAERSTDRLHGGPARLHRPRADMPDDAVEHATPGVGREGQRLRLMGDAPIPAFPGEPGQARALTDWDTMSDKEMLRRCLGLPREVSDEDFMLALRSRIEAKKKNFSISEDNEEVRLPGSVRLEIKVLPSDTAVYLDQRTRSGVKNVHVLEPQGGGWTWRQAQHRARPEVNIAFEKEARPQLALIFLRPWRRAPAAAPPAPGRVLGYKDAQHACTLCISPPDRKDPGSLMIQDKGPGPFLLFACCVVWLAQVKDPGSPTPLLHTLLHQESQHSCNVNMPYLNTTHPGWAKLTSPTLPHMGPGPRACLHSTPCVHSALVQTGPGPLHVLRLVTGPGSLQDRLVRPDPGSLLTCIPSFEQPLPPVFLACMQLGFDAGTLGSPLKTKPIRARPLHAFANVRVGEASHPGPPREDPTVQTAPEPPKPPREITIVRTSPACRGDSQVLRLGSHGEKWLWAVHALPPLRVASRPSESLALDLWISKHGHEITPESLEAARQLLEKWVSYNGPGQTWKDGRKRALSQPADSQAKKTPPPRATSNPPQQPKRKAPTSTGPARRQRKKGPSQTGSLPTTAGPPETFSPPGGDTPEHSQPTEDDLATWKCIWHLAAKPLVTDRHLPREYVGMWQQVCAQVLREQATPEDMSPLC